MKEQQDLFVTASRTDVHLRRPTPRGRGHLDPGRTRDRDRLVLAPAIHDDDVGATITQAPKRRDPAVDRRGLVEHRDHDSHGGEPARHSGSGIPSLFHSGASNSAVMRATVSRSR